MHRGVYAVGHRSVGIEGRWLAATLACGPTAVLSHGSAAALWGFGERPDPGGAARIELTVPGARGRRRPGLSIHAAQIGERERGTFRGVPVTTVTRTLLDLAGTLSGERLERLLDGCQRARRLDAGRLERALIDAAGRRGAGRLRRALDAVHPEGALTRSELERRTLRLIERAGLPRPEANARLHGREVDLLWREHGLVVELDGRAHHASRSAFEADRRRDADLQARGIRVLRFTWRQVTGEPEWVLRRIAALLGAGDPAPGGQVTRSTSSAT
jgi:hypothetical protein